MQLSYADAFRSPLKRWLVRRLERLIGVSELQRRYDQRQRFFDQGYDVFSTAVQLLELNIELCGHPLALLPRTGPSVFVVNHPFGVVDGIVACHLVHQVRNDFRVMVINVANQFAELRPWILPIDFTANEKATSNNLRSRAQAIELLGSGGAVVVFPGGEVATAPRVFGRAVESSWQVFLGRLVQTSGCAVVPMFIHDQNSWRFHLCDRLGTPFRLAMLVHETRRLIGTTITVSLGQPILSEEIKSFRDRRELVAFLKARTLSLACGASHSCANA